MESKKNRVICLFLTILMALFVLGNVSITSMAAENTYALPITYNAGSGVVSATITMTVSTSSIKKGTVITLSGIPKNSANGNRTGYEDVVITQLDSEGYVRWAQEYGRTDDSDSVVNGAVTYTVNSSEFPVHIFFGKYYDIWGWKGTDDGSYYISLKGVVTDEAGNVIASNVASGVSNDLEKSTFNNAEFNAKVYYDNNPDLQTAIGADAQALYKHWQTYGKAEGRKAK